MRVGTRGPPKDELPPEARPTDRLKKGPSKRRRAGPTIWLPTTPEEKGTRGSRPTKNARGLAPY